MKNTVCLLLSGLILWAFRFAAAAPVVATKVYVISLTGSEVHEKPSFQARVVRKLPIGTAVDVVQTIASDDVKQVGAGFALQGDWMKVTAPGYTGYVFSSDVTKRKPEVKKSADGLLSVDLLGVKKSSRVEKKKQPTGNKNSPADYAVLETTEYANCTYTTTTYDGCFDHNYTFRHLTLPEVYHHMISSYAENEYDHSLKATKLEQPKLLSRKGNVYRFTCGFGGSATQDLKLTVQGNGVITISSYDCT
ncbi:SH3 domain-containing protein [Hymenobacter tibetensis]|uniref:SH3 domain-containing protein n=1 Tax=Hymenobacter tibetensis TaxID=497967 RepID=A0ABY4D3X0_9BACT|nr:SH3 domain-containing protein [Hymenobacter tibetensis]UOG75899.1 SH3 domain-containing protein [Hymenobacter tibetensis]